LAYYFKENGCKPLLVAGDTFRSGAVEQLRVHADCLKVPIFHQGYSKDPSVVGQAAIVHATEQGNDVVLIDTAGRMQNNVPLMKALGKLAAECKPDFCLLVAEALVGHDGLDQYRMFTQALGRRGIDGLVVTKFDTVSTKVGASLTLTHETGVPIVFCGTGQKYHHLTKLQAADVVRTLFS
jgi:signal recognition particle receptor subunit alpha